MCSGPPAGLIKKIGRVPAATKQEITLHHGPILVYRAFVPALQQRWASTSYRMQRIRDNPACVDAEFENILDTSDPGLSYNLTFDPSKKSHGLFAGLKNSLLPSSRPKVAILREQGVNGHAEMAFAMMTAGFNAIDVHMTDLIEERVDLSSFVGLAACGGFSYGVSFLQHKSYSPKTLLIRCTGRPRRRSRMGKISPPPSPDQSTVQQFLPAQGYIHPRRLQRMPVSQVALIPLPCRASKNHYLPLSAASKSSSPAPPPGPPSSATSANNTKPAYVPPSNLSPTTTTHNL